MKILTYPLGELEANCYLLIQENDCIIIDPGDSAEFILEEILRNKLEIKAILATHGHFDHIMAVGELQISYGQDIPFYIHEKDLFLVNRLKETSKHFLEHAPLVLEPQNIQFINHQSLIINHFEISFLHTPGHTPGSCAFLIEDAIFTGDTLFKEGIGEYTHSYSNKKELLHSVSLIREKGKDSICYPGHGDNFIIGV